MTFIDDYLAGATTLNEIDDYVARWHECAIGHATELREFLGMSKQEYAIWIQDANAIEEIIAEVILKRTQKYGNSKPK